MNNIKQLVQTAGRSKLLNKNFRKKRGKHNLSKNHTHNTRARSLPPSIQNIVFVTQKILKLQIYLLLYSQPQKYKRSVILLCNKSNDHTPSFNTKGIFKTITRTVANKQFLAQGKSKQFLSRLYFLSRAQCGVDCLEVFLKVRCNNAHKISSLLRNPE